MNYYIKGINLYNINRIRATLFTLDINPKYASFEYLVLIVKDLITNNNYTQSFYIYELNNIARRFNITTRSLSNSINALLKDCEKNLLKQKNQFNIRQNSTLNKVRVICKFVVDNLSKMHQ